MLAIFEIAQGCAETIKCLLVSIMYTFLLNAGLAKQKCLHAKELVAKIACSFRGLKGSKYGGKCCRIAANLRQLRKAFKTRDKQRLLPLPGSL